MRKVAVVNSVSLDGVMQAPGRAGEDLRGGFEHGGWAPPYHDAVQSQAMGQGMAGGFELLFGRRTYEDFFKVWPSRKDNPFSEILTNARKHVASRTLREPLPWQNSHLLSGDAAESVARLRGEAGPGLVILGSGELIASLLQHHLVDQMTLLIHPLLLGSGRRLFPDHGSIERFRLVSSVTTTTGVIIATLEATDGGGRSLEQLLTPDHPARVGGISQ